MAVMDRSALILDIFAQRACTREGRLQVELAQYKYLLPRLLGMWTHLERQEGAIGTRGPGARPSWRPTGGISTERSLSWRTSCGRAPGARHPAGAADQKRGAGGGHRGLYQRGQIHVAEQADRGGDPGQQPAVRHPGHHPPAPWRSRTPARCSCPIRWALSASCPTIWWRPSGHSEEPPLPTCCSMSSTRPTPSGGSRRRWWISSSTSWGRPDPQAGGVQQVRPVDGRDPSPWGEHRLHLRPHRRGVPAPAGGHWAAAGQRG